MSFPHPAAWRGAACSVAIPPRSTTEGQPDGELPADNSPRAPTDTCASNVYCGESRRHGKQYAQAQCRGCYAVSRRRSQSEVHMNAARLFASSLFAAMLALAVSSVASGQIPPPGMLSRLEALKLNSVTAGDVPAHYSKSVAREVAGSVAGRVAACRSLHAETVGRPRVVAAILDAGDWNRVTQV